MNIYRTSMHRALTTLAFVALTWSVGAAAPVRAGTVDLSNTPPDLTKSVDPNIALTFDDSGSMGDAYMGDTRPFDHKFWTGYYYGTDPWLCAGQIDPRVTDTTNLKSHAMNGVYYNPNNDYLPPKYQNGSAFSNADDTLKKVWNDGIRVNRPKDASTGNGTENFTGTDDTNKEDGSDNRWTCLDDATSPIAGGGPYYYRLKQSVDITNADGSVNTSALYNANNWEAVSVPKGEYQNWANWWAYYRTRNLMTRTAVSRVFGSFGTNIRVVYQNINNKSYKLNSDTTIGAFANDSNDPDNTQRRTDFFNWVFQIGHSGNTPNRRATIRVGNFFSRSLTLNDKDPYWNGKADPDAADLACRQNFHMLVTDGFWNTSDDPDEPTGYFSSETSRTLPDSKAYDPDAAVSKIYGNNAGTDHEPSLANLGWFYWAQDLEPDLANNVAPYYPDLTTGVTAAASSPDAKNPGATPEVYWNPANDPANWQHVVQFMVTLGVGGTLNFPNDLTALRKGTKQWPDPKNNAPEAIDDTWHAAINSRGEFFSASDPQTLVNKLTDIINSISQRTSSNVAASLSSNVATAGSLSFAAGFNSTDWSGTLVAQKINDDGSLGATLWHAGQVLTANANKTASNRNIYTSTATGAGHGDDFEWDKLSGVEQVWLDTVPYTGTLTLDNKGKDRLAWLRGDRSKEGTTFRTRSSLLGAIIDSQPVFNSYPSSGYNNYFPPLPNGHDAPEVAAYKADADTTYAAFVRKHLTRAPTVYVGANDGMLHAFDATEAGGGAERWAYVPYGVYPDLSKLMEKDNFQFVPTVDATPTVGDVFYGGNWHTILVGGLRYGGRGVYALDVTEPKAADATATKRVLWEFTPDVVSNPPACAVNSNKSKCNITVDTGKGSGNCAGNSKGKKGKGKKGKGKKGKGKKGKGKKGKGKKGKGKKGKGKKGKGKKGKGKKGKDSGTDPCPPAPDTTDPAANLGYTFGQPQLARIADGGKWVVLVPGGYFPDDSTAPAASNTFSSLFVLDAQTGAVIKEMQTPTTWGGEDVTSYGLATPVVGDYQNDQVADVAFAGDLQGNLWRFDFTDPDPANWKVSLVYKPTTAGAQPITTEPRLFPTPFSTNFTVVFGTGKFLGRSDRTNDSSETQAVYGIREKGTSAADTIAITKSDLTQQTLHDDGNGTRALSDNAVPLTSSGWYFNLNIDKAKGERVVTTPFALFSTGQALISTLIPGTSNPCDPSRSGALMLVNAATGGSSKGLNYPAWTGTLPSGANVVGGRVANAPTSGTLPVASLLGGGAGVAVGMSYENAKGVQSQAGGNFFPLTKRRDWRAIEHN